MRRVVLVAVGMHVACAVAVLVRAEMHPLAPQPPQHMAAERQQHQPDAELEPIRHVVGKARLEQEAATGHHQQRQRMSKSPERAVQRDAAKAAAAADDARNSGDMIRLQRVLHPQ